MNILITGAWQGAQQHIAEIEQMGHEVCFMQYEKDELHCDYDWVDGVICNGLFLHHEIEKFTNLKYIQLTSAGYDRVPMDYVKAHGIEIHNAKGVYSIPMAEFAVAGVLSLYKKLDTFKQQQKNHQWIKQRDLLELNGKTVCIVGCGDVGKECAKRFEAFGCKVIGVNRTVREKSYFLTVYSLDEIDAVLKQSDVIVFTISLTDVTRYLIDAERLSILKSDVVLVNISRGAVIDTDALINWLNAHPASGAVLDVFENEPLDGNSELWKMRNIIVTPHNSFVGECNKNRLKNTIFSHL